MAKYVTYDLSFHQLVSFAVEGRHRVAVGKILLSFSGYFYKRYSRRFSHTRVRVVYNYINHIFMFLLCGKNSITATPYSSIIYRRIASFLRNEKRVFYDFLPTIARNLRDNSEKFTKNAKWRVFYGFSMTFEAILGILVPELPFFVFQTTTAKI